MNFQKALAFIAISLLMAPWVSGQIPGQVSRGPFKVERVYFIQDGRPEELIAYFESRETAAAYAARLNKSVRFSDPFTYIASAVAPTSANYTRPPISTPRPRVNYGTGGSNTSPQSSPKDLWFESLKRESEAINRRKAEMDRKLEEINRTPHGGWRNLLIRSYNQQKASYDQTLKAYKTDLSRYAAQKKRAEAGVPTVRVPSPTRIAEPRIDKSESVSSPRRIKAANRDETETPLDGSAPVRTGRVYGSYHSYDGHRLFMFLDSGVFVKGSGGQTPNLRHGKDYDYRYALEDIKRSLLVAKEQGSEYPLKWRRVGARKIEVSEAGKAVKTYEVSPDGSYMELTEDSREGVNGVFFRIQLLN